MIPRMYATAVALASLLAVPLGAQPPAVDLARAERYVRHHLEQEPEPGTTSHAVAHWRLGLVLEKQGRKADAVAELQTAAKMDPKLEPARKDLKRLTAGS